MNEMYETSTSTIFQEFKDFVRDYYDRKDISTISLGSGISREEFEKLLKAKVVKVFEKLWGFQIDQVTYDRVRKAIDLGKLPQDFIDPLNAGIDEWIQNEWSPVYKEAMTLAANGTAQITGMVGKIASATGVGVIFNPDTQRMLNLIDTEGLNLAVQLKKEQIQTLRVTLRRSIAEKWTRASTIQNMRLNVSLTDRELKWLDNYTGRQRKALRKYFKKEFPGLSEAEREKRVEAVVKKRRRDKYNFYRRSRSERFYRTELSRAKFDGEIEGMTQAQEQGAIKNAKKKWVSTNNIDRWESTSRYNGKIVPIDGDFWKLYGKPEKTTMLDGKKPGEINELCELQYFAEKGDGKPVAVEAVAPFVPAKTIKEAEEYAVKSGFGKTVNYEGVSLENANFLNERLSKSFNKIKFNPIDIDITQNSNYVAFANEGRLTVSNYWLGEKRQGELLKNFKTDFRSSNIEKLKRYKAELGKPGISSDDERFLRKSIGKIEEELKFRIGHAINESDLLESLIDHELGHVIHGQKMNFFVPVPNELPAITKLRQEWSGINKQLIESEKIFDISKYASVDEAECFAECFSMYFFEKEKLPGNIIKFIEKVLK